MNKLDTIISAIRQRNKNAVVNAMKERLRNGDCIYEKQDETGKTILIHLVASKEPSFMDLVSQVLLRNANCIDIPDNTGQTALMYAAMIGNTDLLNIFADYSANTQLTNKAQQTALMLASQCGHHAFLETMRQRGHPVDVEESQRALLLAAENGHPAVVDFLLSEGVSSAVTAADHQIPLMLAIHNGHCIVIERLACQYAVNNLLFTAEYATQHGRASLELFNSIPLTHGILIKKIKNSLCDLSESLLSKLYTVVNWIPENFFCSRYLAKPSKYVSKRVIQPLQNVLLTISDDNRVDAVKLFYVISDNATATTSEVPQNHLLKTIPVTADHDDSPNRYGPAFDGERRSQSHIEASPIMTTPLFPQALNSTETGLTRKEKVHINNLEIEKITLRIENIKLDAAARTRSYDDPSYLSRYPSSNSSNTHTTVASLTPFPSNYQDCIDSETPWEKSLGLAHDLASLTSSSDGGWNSSDQQPMVIYRGTSLGLPPNPG